LELVHAAARVQREGVHVLIVGDGDGMRHLVAAAKQARVPVHLQGHVSPSEVPAHLAAMDVASLPQSTDRLGVFRYSTKLPEYLAAKLPVVTGELPVAYDLDRGWLWRLPGMAPWDDEYIAALAALMENVDVGDVARRREAVPQSLPDFDREAQQTRVTAFVRETVARQRSA
jgi:predicted CoA-binding protein